MSVRRLRMAVLLSLVGMTSAANAAFVNFESGHVRPLALSPAGDLLFAVNTPDNRLVIYTVSGAGLTLTAEVPVGLEPVAVAVRAIPGSKLEAFVVNHLSDSVSVVEVDLADVAHARVKRTLLVGDEPRDVVIAGSSNDRVFVTAAHRGQNRPGSAQLTAEGTGRCDVWVFDANTLGADTTLGGTPLGGAPITFFGDTPRALARSPLGDRVYVAVFHSGNQTTSINELSAHSAGAPPYPPPPPGSAASPPSVGLIVKRDAISGQWRDELNQNWSTFVPFSLPDQDVFILNADASTATIMQNTATPVTGVGTVLFNMAVRPHAPAVPERLYVTNTDARNQVRFEPVLHGHLAESRITVVQGGVATGHHLNPHINYGVTPGPQTEIDQSVAFPLDMAFSSDGLTLYVAAFGSGKVGVFDAASLEAGTVIENQVAVGGGPTGLALDEANNRLYVMNRFDQNISIVSNVNNPGLRAESAKVSLHYDPEPTFVKIGRPLLYEAKRSGHGDSACASCHIFADFDSLAWDLGDSVSTTVPQNFNPFRVPVGNPKFHPLKGPMTTQSLRGMDNAGPMHWRGDRTGATSGNPNGAFDEPTNFGKFNPAFQGLLGAANQLTTGAGSEMEKFTNFILSVVYPPNPNAPLSGTFAVGSPEALGQTFFSGTPVDGGLLCATCHVLPFGTDGRSSFEGEPQEFKIAHLRNAYKKIGMFGVPPGTGGPGTGDLGPQVRGFGFLHDGAIDTVHDFLRAPVFNFSNDTQRTNLEAFIMSFDTGLAAAVGQEVTIGPLTFNDAAFTGRIDTLIAADDAGRCELIVKGNLAGVARGARYVNSNNFETDLVADGLIPKGTLRGLAATPGQELTYTCVPPGNGIRAGIDRDEDGFRDQDEIMAGSDPGNPLSIPSGSTTTTVSTTSTSTSTTSTSTSTTSTTSTSTSTTSTSTSTTSTSTSTSTTTSSTIGGGTTSSTTTSTSSTTSTTVPTVLVPTSSLKLSDGGSPPTTRKLSFKSSTKRDAPDRIVPPAPGSADDPSLHGATVEVYNASGTPEKITVVIPGVAGWKVTGGGSYRYKNPDRFGAISKITIKADQLRVSGGGGNFTYSLDEPSQGSVAVRLRTLPSGTVWCADATAPRVDTVGRFQASPQTPPPGVCPAVP